MPLDVRGCTRATLSGSACVYPSPRGVGNPLNPTRDRDWGLQLFPMNEEFPVSAGHKLALIKSLPFVHTARRYYRLDGLVRSSDRPRRDRSRSWRSAEKTIKLDYLEEVNLRKDHYRFSPSIRGERNKQKPKPRGWVRGEGSGCFGSLRRFSLLSLPRGELALLLDEGTARGGLPEVPAGCSVPRLTGTGLEKTRNTDSSAVRRPRPGRPPCASGYLTPLPPPGAGVRGSMPPPPAAAPAGAGRSARRYCYPHIVKPNAVS
ncbi:hypothetical protein NQZ68_040499 [Dissostichus eleginoides]|nr:hypothetical protein NQZ68_040499 [Dissostichus eleginoides]